MGRVCLLLPLVLAAVVCHARKDKMWESMFDVPSGFRSYQAQRDSGHRPDLTDMAAGFEGFLDEGLEGDVRAPLHLHHQHHEHQPQAEHHFEHHDHNGHRHHHMHQDMDLERSPTYHAQREHHTEHHSDHHGYHHDEHAHHDMHAHHAHHEHADGHSARYEGNVEFLELGRDMALEEAERDAQAAQRPPAPQITTAAAPSDASDDSDVPAASTDRPEDTLAAHFKPPAPVPEAAGFAGMQPNAHKHTALEDVLQGEEGDLPPIQSPEEFMERVRLLEQAIVMRKAGEPSLTDSITQAAKSGEIVKIIPRVPLRQGLQPGVLPGIVDTAQTTAAALAPLIGDNLANNVKMVSELQSNPAAVEQLQNQLPSAIPDLPQLHPLSKVREQAAAAKNHVDVMPEGPVPAMVEVASKSEATDDEHHHHHHHHAEDDVAPLREDQAVDLQYLRGIGQGMEMLVDLFGGKDPSLQKQALEASAALKSIGATEENPLSASYLEVEEATAGIGDMYRAPPGHRSKMASLPSAGAGDRVMSPSTYAAAPVEPSTPNPSTPRDELAWMLEGLQAKGYTLDSSNNPPEKLDLKRLMDTIKGFFKKGQKLVDLTEANHPENKVDPNWKNPGFEGWPQPFWWTRPPAWLDDIPAWMQRLELKKANSVHKHAVYG